MIGAGSACDGVTSGSESLHVTRRQNLVNGQASIGVVKAGEGPGAVRVSGGLLVTCIQSAACVLIDEDGHAAKTAVTGS